VDEVAGGQTDSLIQDTCSGPRVNCALAAESTRSRADVDGVVWSGAFHEFHHHVNLQIELLECRPWTAPQRQWRRLFA
jgi:hypothetical protein